MEEMMKYMIGEMEKNAAFRAEVVKMTNRQTSAIRFLTLIAGVAIGYAVYTRKRASEKEV